MSYEGPSGSSPTDTRVDEVIARGAAAFVAGNDAASSSDERIALALLTLSSDLLRMRHPAVAAMIDYAVADIIRGTED